MTTAPTASASPKTVNAVGIRSSVLFPAVELAKKPNKTRSKIISLSSLQETAFLSYSNHRRASNPTMESKNMTRKELQTMTYGRNTDGFERTVRRLFGFRIPPKTFTDAQVKAVVIAHGDEMAADAASIENYRRAKEAL